MMKNWIRGLAAAAALLAGPAMGQVATPPGGPENPEVGNAGLFGEQEDTPLIVCFAEGTDEKYVAQVMAYVTAYNEQFDQQRYHTGTRWSGSQGTPRTVTWSFVPDGLSITGSAGEPTSPSNLFAQMDTKFARATWIAHVQSCFDRWQEISGISFTRITVGGNDWDDGASWSSSGAATRGDIRVSMHNIDGASGILAYAFFPSNGNMVLDSGDINNFGSATNSARFFRNTFMHELGHAIGFDHTCSSNSNILMEPFLSTAFDGPRHDDLRAVHRHYGDVSGTTTSSGTARNLGTLVSGTPINVGTPFPNPDSGTNDTQVSTVSLDDDGEADWYKFDTTATLTLTATLTPLGKTYADDTQAANGNCNSGTTTNSLTILNMKIEVFASNGTTLLGSADAGAAGVVETISGLSLAPGTYFAKISSAAGTSASQMYTLALSGSGCTAPSITGQPGSLTRCTGTSATFTVTATNATGFQWRKNGTNIGGATSSSYTIASVVSGDAANYDCVVSNACSSVTSNVATLTVNTTANITGQPSNQTKCVGQSASFTVTATGATGFQWRKNSTNIGGATSSTYTIASVVSGDVGSYDCVVSNSCGNVTSNAATLTVNTTANITGQPSNQTACVGQPASFSVTATGATGFQWRKNTTNIGGATSSTYTIASVVSGDAASYDCVVSNGCGNVTSNAATLTVNTGASITGQPGNQSVCEGQPASFSVTATGATGYQWRKGGVDIGGATSSSYTIASVVAADAGSYDCVVSSDCGDTTSNAATLSVGEAPAITGQPTGGNVCRGGSITLTVTATGATSYQWRKGGVDIGGATSSSYTINPAALTDAGSYDCVVSSGCADATSDAASVVVCAADFNCDGFINGDDYDAFAELFEI
ncbi:MAG: matrixin family metalloprotease, partial [Phycisphaerae bacterium]|nr:matrixin family metalloprotease [Phycisphaerae bacterium]